MKLLLLPLTVVMLLCLGAAWPPEAAAQRRYSPPAGPPISPYMQYFRANTGVYDNYNQFVRPALRLRNTVNQQQAGLRGLQNQVGTMQSFLRQEGEARFQGPTTVSPTSRVPTQLNYSHYFPGLGGRGR